jgi:hypothetical protein
MTATAYAPGSFGQTPNIGEPDCPLHASASVVMARSQEYRRRCQLGSKADMCAAKGHVCFTPESGHMQCN